MEAITEAPVRPYERPELGWSGEPAQSEHVVWWAVFVGFAYVLALAWASYCTYKGGHPDISFKWTGFKVTCSR